MQIIVKIDKNREKFRIYLEAKSLAVLFVKYPAALYCLACLWKFYEKSERKKIYS